MATFAEYILEQQDLKQKIHSVLLLQRKSGIFFDATVTAKTELAKLFIEEMDLDVDKNLVLTACLLYACKKSDAPQIYDRIVSYSKEGAQYLETQGFDKRFCRICEGHNRYTIENKREYESDLLEVIDQFGAMLLHRQDRPAYAIADALCLLEYRNLKGKANRFLERFKEFADRDLAS